MALIETKIFKSNRTQAVRLPKKVAFPESVKSVEIIAVGSKRIIVPKGHAWDEWFNGPGVSADFMSCRSQEEDQLRDDM